MDKKVEAIIETKGLLTTISLDTIDTKVLETECLWIVLRMNLIEVSGLNITSITLNLEEGKEQM